MADKKRLSVRKTLDCVTFKRYFEDAENLKENQLPQAAISGLEDKPSASRQATGTSEALLALVEDNLTKEKGENIVLIPLAGKSSIADYMVIASGRSTRQVSAMAEKLVEEIKGAGHGTPKVEGKENADWVLIDAGDVIVHLFRPEVREFYQLEKFWAGDDALPGGKSAS